jgi:polyhydroxyalkanoate synthesis regulator phasin
MSNVEEEFEKHQQELIDRFISKLKDIANEEIDNLYTDVSYHACSDANINYKNKLRDEVRSEFMKEISEVEGSWSWANSMRMELLAKHPETLQNTIIKDLQEEVSRLKDHIEEMKGLYR